jgi:glucokinase
MTSGEPVLALDIGGSKVSGAVVDPTGQILRHSRVDVAVRKGPDAFFAQLIQTLSDLSRDFSIQRVGIGCAGPLSGKTGELLDPTNFFTDGKSWGRLSLLDPLRAKWPRWKFFLDNDAAAAVLGEAWLGGVASDNLLVMTLGTGVGVGVLVDGQLVRTRGGLHPESSHIPLNCTDTAVRCGCGNLGCIEAYLAGSHFASRLAGKIKEPGLTGQRIVHLAKAVDKITLMELANYGEWMAQAIHAFAVLYGPRQISLSGGFAAAAPWFLPTVEKRLPELLARRRGPGDDFDLLPKVSVSRLGDNLGVLGAARVAMLG